MDIASLPWGWIKENGGDLLRIALFTMGTLVTFAGALGVVLRLRPEDVNFSELAITPRLDDGRVNPEVLLNFQVYNGASVAIRLTGASGRLKVDHQSFSTELDIDEPLRLEPKSKGRVTFIQRLRRDEADFLGKFVGHGKCGGVFDFSRAKCIIEASRFQVILASRICATLDGAEVL